MYTILLAEDDVDDQELLTEAFNDIDPSIRLQCFSSGKKILNYLNDLPGDQHPNLIILDYNIPELNGAEILQKLKENSRYEDTVKLVWSTSDSPLFEKSCLNNGARAYLVKPSSLTGLNEMARKMLSFAN